MGSLKDCTDRLEMICEGKCINFDGKLVEIGQSVLIVVISVRIVGKFSSV